MYRLLIVSRNYLRGTCSFFLSSFNFTHLPQFHQFAETISFFFKADSRIKNGSSAHLFCATKFSQLVQRLLRLGGHEQHKRRTR